MRRLMWFTIGFGCACAAGAYLLPQEPPFLCVAALILLVSGCVLCHIWLVLRPMRIVVIGLAMGAVLYLGFDSLYLQSARQADGCTMQITAELSDYSYETEYGSAANAKLRLQGKEYSVLIYLDENQELKPGDRVSGLFRLRYTHRPEDASYHRGNGVFLLADQRDAVTVTVCEESPLRWFPAVFRRNLIETINSVFPADTAFFARALLLGDRSDVNYETNTAFKASGISHIIAVSGLHISILFSVVMLLTGRRRWLSAIIGVPVLLLFAAVAGFTPSITRACLMQILMLLALLFDREYDSPTALSFAALVMMVLNPVAITSVSFQLSSGCIAGILCFSQPIRSWICGWSIWRNYKRGSFLASLREWIAGGVGITISSMFFTTLLVAGYFSTVSLVGILTNLLTLWAVTVVFYGIMAVCLVALLWTKAAAVLAWVISWLIRYILAISKALSAFSASAVYTESVYIVAWIVLCYVLVTVFLLLRRSRPYVLICCMVLSLMLSLLCSWIEPMTVTDRVMVLDVGQGQCVLIQSGGCNYMVDCGGDRDSQAADVAAQTLLSMGINRLDGMIVTHYDRDHAGGVPHLLSRIAVDKVYLPSVESENDDLNSILAYCEESHFFVDDDLLLEWGNSRMVIYAPLVKGSDNESGISVLFDGEKCDILITGDMSTLGEMLLVKQKHIPQVTALVAGHHGSSGSTGELLLAATQPEYVFISVGEDNFYGHPSDKVLKRLEAAGCTVYRTDLDGTIIFGR